MSGSSFDDTLEAARNGSQPAWRRIIDDLGPRLVGFFRSRGSTDPEALAGDVLLDVARNIGSFTGDEGGFRSWVFVIAHRRWVDERRRLGRRVAESPTDSLHDSHELARSAEDEAIDALGSERAIRLLAELTDDQRDVLTLRIVAGLSLEETALAVGKPLGAVKALQRRGLNRLRKGISSEAVSRDADSTIA